MPRSDVRSQRSFNRCLYGNKERGSHPEAASSLWPSFCRRMKTDTDFLNRHAVPSFPDRPNGQEPRYQSGHTRGEGSPAPCITGQFGSSPRDEYFNNLLG